MGQFWGVGNSTPGISGAEKLIGSGKKKKKKKIGITSRRMALEPIKKKTNVISIYSGTGHVSQGLYLSMFKKDLHLWKPGAY